MQAGIEESGVHLIDLGKFKDFAVAACLGAMVCGVIVRGG